MYIIYLFFSFPKDVEKKNKWLKALALEKYNPPKTGAVCSEHFRKEDYETNSSLRKLKKDAIPYVRTKKS